MSFTLTEAEKKELRKQQKKAKSNKDVVRYIKLSVLLGINAKVSLQLISEMPGVNITTIYEYKNRYDKSKKLCDYLATHYEGVGCPRTLTKEEIEILKQELDTGYYASCKAIAVFIKKRFSKDFMPNGLRFLLKRLGYVYKQVAIIPGKADSEKQRKYLKEMEGIKENLAKNNEKMYFLDGVHPTHNTRSVKVWCRKGVEKPLKGNTGRHRININGAINGMDPCDVIYRIDHKINGESTINLFEQILARNQQVTKIHLFCDNAKYYYNKDVKRYVEENSRLVIHYLPTYSPNLNLIERLWRFLRREKLDLHHYEKAVDFERSIFDFFDNIEKYRDKLASLITFKFHIRDTSGLG